LSSAELGHLGVGEPRSVVKQMSHRDLASSRVRQLELGEVLLNGVIQVDQAASTSCITASAVKDLASDATRNRVSLRTAAPVESCP
jgi:molybdopterin-binding protein